MITDVALTEDVTWFSLMHKKYLQRQFEQITSLEEQHSGCVVYMADFFNSNTLPDNVSVFTGELAVLQAAGCAEAVEPP